MIDEPGTLDDTEPSSYVRGLPIGAPLPPTDRDMTAWDEFPWAGEFTVKPLDEPVLPEPPRSGEADPAECFACAKPDEEFIWVDDRWRICHHGSAPGLPVLLLLMPRAHHDFADLPADLTAELGVLLQRAERAVSAIGGVGRVHVYRWGDGAAHLHWWFVARPAGMLQMRGTLLPLWNSVLPRRPEPEWQDDLRTVAAAMAEGGGRSML